MKPCDSLNPAYYQKLANVVTKLLTRATVSLIINFTVKLVC